MMRSLSSSRNGELGILMLIIFFIMFLFITAFYVTDDPNVQESFEFFNKTVGDYAEEQTSKQYQSNDDDWWDGSWFEPFFEWGESLVDGIGSVLDTMLIGLNIITDFFRIVWMLITMDIQALNSLGIWAYCIKIPVWIGIIYIVVKTLPFT